MWILFGALAVIATILNFYLYFTRKDNKLAFASALAFTLLTMAEQYRLISSWVKVEDWAALADVVPTMNLLLYPFVIGSILLNVTPIILDTRNKHNGKVNHA